MPLRFDGKPAISADVIYDDGYLGIQDRKVHAKFLEGREVLIELETKIGRVKALVALDGARDAIANAMRKCKMS